MDPAVEQQSGSSRQAANSEGVFTAVRRQWQLVIAVLATGLVIGVGLELVRDPEYRAVSAVALSMNDVSGELGEGSAPRVQQDPVRITETQADLIAQPVVAQRVVAALPGLRLTVKGLLERVSAAAGPNSDIIRITVLERTRGRSRQIAAAYARAYVSYRQRLDTSAIQRTRAALTSRIRGLRSSRGSERLIDRLVRKDQDLLVLESLQTANASVVRDPVTVDQTSPAPVRGGIVGVALGLFVGLLAAVWRNGRDERLRDAAEVVEITKAPHLGDLPRPPARNAGETRLVMLGGPERVEAEAFRMLRTRLDFQLGGREIRKLMIASALPGEGKTTTAANLAVAFAMAGRDVALLELDMRKRDLRGLLDVPEGPGLSDVAIGAANLEEAAYEVSLPVPAGQPQSGRLIFYRAGTLPPDVAEFMTRPTVARIMDEVAGRHELTVMDTPALLAVSDAQTLLPLSDAVMVVARAKSTTHHALKGAVDIISAAGSPILGFVFTDSELLVNSYGRGRYSYAYAAPNQPEDQAKTDAAV
jgi:succinoglycan biosynthesis transport protein ExoP